MSEQILVVGSLNMDLVTCGSRMPTAGETITARAFFKEPGGKGANQAFAIARLGGHVSLLGRVGQDEFGRLMCERLQQVGCDVSRVGRIPNAVSGIAVVFVADDAQNSIVIVPGANGQLTAQDVEAERENLFLGSSVVLLQLENPYSTVFAAAQVARGVGARVILDPAPAPATTLSEELLQLVDVLTPNETEASILAGSRPGRLNMAQAAEIAEMLTARGAKSVVVKLGDRGCLVLRHVNYET